MVLFCFQIVITSPEGSTIRIMWGPVYVRVFQKLRRAIEIEVAGGIIIMTLKC